MLFAAPEKALAAARRALRPGGRIAAVVFTTRDANPFMARPMEILLRRAGKDPPTPGEPGIFALGEPETLERLLRTAGFASIEQRTLETPLRMPSAADALAMMQEAFGAYRAVVDDRPEAVRREAWAAVAEALRDYAGPGGFVAPAEVLVAAGVRP